ncbi:MAG: serine hydrolase domain-containing protein, partial [Planctomycetaceae bacterium]
GLIPDNSLKDYTGSRDDSFRKIAELKLSAPPGEKFMYSDVGFLVLGRIVERITGDTLSVFVTQNICEPLNLQETGYQPSPELAARAAVTQQRDGQWMQGQVHDPRAWALEGIAGHAGLFSTADDLAAYATMMLNHGALDGQRILSPDSIRVFTTGLEVPRGRRTPGWDSLSPYSSNRGDLMSEQAFGHGGFTGTGIWIDPADNLYVIFLSNRVHPDGKGSVNALIGRTGTIATAAIRP